MHGRAKIVLYLLGLMILAVAPAACGGGSSQKSSPANTAGSPVIEQIATPTTPLVTTGTPKLSTPATSPTAAAQATAVTPAISTPKATPAPSPASTPTPPTVAATTPAPLGPGNVTLNDSWFVSPSIGWLVGQGCVQVKPGTSTGQPPVMQCTGVIFRTIDGGRHWSTLLTGSLIPCKLQFTTDQTGWLIGVKNGENGDCSGDTPGTGVIQQTSDGGASWTTRYLTSHPGTFPIDLRFTSNDQGWVTLQNCPSEESPCSWQVISTSDAGQNWNTATIPITAHQASLAHPDASDGWVIAGGNGHVNIADSHDGGRTWQIRLIPVSESGWQATIFFLNAQQGWFLTGGEPGAGEQYKAMYHTTDGGTTWNIVEGENTKSPAPGPLGAFGYVGPIIFTTPNDGWAFLPRLGVLQTTDGGKSWESGAPFNDGAGWEQDLHFRGQTLGWSTFEGFVMLTDDSGASWQSVLMPDGVSRNYGSPG